MKLFVMYASIFVLAFGLAASLAVVTNAEPAPFCNTSIYEPFEWCSTDTGPLCQSPLHYLYICNGRYAQGHGPCECTFIGCCE